MIYEDVDSVPFNDGEQFDSWRSQKDSAQIIEALIKIIVNNDAMSSVLSNKIKELEDRLYAFKHAAEVCRQRVKEEMLKSEIKKIKAPEYTVYMKKNPDVVKVIREYELPEKYIVTSRRPDLKGIQAHYRDTGELVDGEDIVDGGVSVVIKC